MAAADNEQLAIVITATDNASGVISGVQTKIKSWEQSQQELTASMAQLDAAQNQVANSIEDENAKVQAQAAAIRESDAAAKQLYEDKLLVAQTLRANGEALTEEQTQLLADAEAAEANAAAHSALSDKIQSTGSRLIAHAIIIGGAIAAYSAIKSAVEDSEKANQTYTKSFEAADQQIEKSKIQLGNVFLPVVENVKQTLADLSKQNDLTSTSAGSFRDIVFGLGQGLQVLMVIAKGTADLLRDSFGTVIVAVIEGVKNFALAVYDTGKAIDDVVHGRIKEANADLDKISSLSWTAVTNSWNQGQKDIDATASEIGKIINEKIPDLSDHANKVKKGSDTIINEFQKLKQSLSEYDTKATEDLQNLKTTHDNFVETVTTKLSDLQTQYDNTVANGAEKLQQLANSHASAAASIQNSINSIQNSINNLNASYANQQTSNEDNLIKAFAKAQEDVKSLTAAIANPSTSASTVTTDKAQLEQTQQTLADNADLVAKYQDQITAQVKFDEEGALKQAIDTFNKKQQQDQIAYQTKLQQYQGEIVALNAKAAAETDAYNQEVLHAQAETAASLAKIKEEQDKYTEQQKTEQALYDAKTKAITQLQSDAEKAIQQLNNDTFAITKKNVEAEIELYQRLAAAMAAVGAAKSPGAVTTAASIPHHAEGGIVTSPEVALIGEAGPEAIIPLTGPNAGVGLGGGSNYTVNIINPSVRSASDIAELKRQIEQVMRPLFLNAKPNYA